MSEIKVIHTCTHTVTEYFTREQNKEVVRSLTDIDIVPSEYPIKEITGLVHGETDYVPDADFQKVGRNMLRWTALNKPETGDRYTVFYTEQASFNRVFDIGECPKCNGRGWYVGLMNDETGKIEKVNGIERLIQDYLKILLTCIGENRLNVLYGSELLKLPSNNLTYSTEVENRIRIILKECESNLRKIQSENLQNLPEDEILQRVDINDISYVHKLRKYVISIRVISQSMDEAETSFGI
jgi:hypothetical protein